MIGYNVLNNGKCCPIVGIESDSPVKGSKSRKLSISPNEMKSGSRHQCSVLT